MKFSDSYLGPIGLNGKNPGRGCVCGNGLGVVENGYNEKITRIAADAVWFLTERVWTYNCIFVVELQLLCNIMQLAIIIVIFEIFLVYY